MQPMQPENSDSIGLNDFKDFVNNKVDSLKEEIQQSSNTKLIQIKSAFRCIVCYNSTPNCYMACFFCGRYLGCFNCICRLESCPVCRKKFQCTNCDKKLPFNPLFISSIEDMLDLPPIKRREEQALNENHSTASADTAPYAEED